jgi:hypothetical protein
MQLCRLILPVNATKRYGTQIAPSVNFLASPSEKSIHLAYDVCDSKGERCSMRIIQTIVQFSASQCVEKFSVSLNGPPTARQIRFAFAAPFVSFGTKM